MDIEKAIEWQEEFKRTYKNSPMEKEVFEACDMAIEALNKMKNIILNNILQEDGLL